MKQEFKLAACFVCALIALYLYMRQDSGKIEVEASQPIKQATVATPIPTQPPSPQPTDPPQPRSYIKQTGSRSWEVFLYKNDGWFDTRIPVIAGQVADVRRDDDSKTRWLLKANNTVLYDSDFNHSMDLDFREISERGGQGPVGYIGLDFRDTIKVKIQDDHPETHLQVSVRECGSSGAVDIEGYRLCCDERDPYHIAAHRRSILWAKAMLKKIAQE